MESTVCGDPEGELGSVAEFGRRCKRIEEALEEKEKTLVVRFNLAQRVI